MSSNSTIRSDSPSAAYFSESESAIGEISDILAERARLIQWLSSVHFHAKNSSQESRASLRELAATIPSSNLEEMREVETLLWEACRGTSPAPQLALAAKCALIELLPGTTRVFGTLPSGP